MPYTILTMRTLFLLRGLPGCGKSTWLQKTGYAAYALSADTIRTLYAGPDLAADGGWRIPQENDKTVWQFCLSG
jgi:predicted kinase